MWYKNWEPTVFSSPVKNAEFLKTCQLVMLDFYPNFRQRRWSLQLRQGVRGLQALQLPRLPQLLLQVPLLQEVVGGRDEGELIMKGLANADFYLNPSLSMDVKYS